MNFSRGGNPMAKQKHVKPQYVPKANRPKKKPYLPKARKIELAIVAGVMLLAVVLFIAFYNDGSLPMVDGVAQREPSWLIQDLSGNNQGKYYKLAEYTVPEGYYHDTESTSTTNKNRTEFWMKPNDPESPVRYGYVVGVTKPPEEIAVAGHDALVGFNTGESVISDIGHAELNGIRAPYFTNLMTNQDNGEVTKQISTYLPAAHNAGVMVAVTVVVNEQHPEMTDEQMLALAEVFAATVKVEAE
jgi:hypothetical protein